MAEIRIHRDHALGLSRARQAARQWVTTAERKFDLACTLVEGEAADVVEFRRAGVDGRLVVAGDRVELTARLGLLLGAFGQRIESEIEDHLDALLAGAEATPAARAVRRKA